MAYQQGRKELHPKEGPQSKVKHKSKYIGSLEHSYEFKYICVFCVASCKTEFGLHVLSKINKQFYLQLLTHRTFSQDLYFFSPLNIKSNSLHQNLVILQLQLSVPWSKHPPYTPTIPSSILLKKHHEHESELLFLFCRGETEETAQYFSYRCTLYQQQN